MSRKSIVLVFFLVFSVSSLLPLFLPSYAAADTMGWYLQDTGTEGAYFGVSAVDSDTVWAGEAQ